MQQGEYIKNSGEIKDFLYYIRNRKYYTRPFRFKKLLMLNSGLPVYETSY